MRTDPVLVSVPGGPGAQPAFQPLPDGTRWWQVCNGGPADAEVYMQVDGKSLQIETVATKASGVIHPAPEGRDVRYGVTSTGALANDTSCILLFS